MGEAKRKKFLVERVAVEPARRFYVYLHRIIYPDTNTFVPVYVGKGTGDRKLSHFNDLKKGTHSNRLFQSVFNIYNKLADLKLEKGEWRVQTFEAPDGGLFYEWEAFDIERHCVKEHGRRDNGTGCLTNLTDGGEGTSGRILSDEQIAALSVGMAQKWLDPIFRAERLAASNKVSDDIRLNRSRLMSEFMADQSNREAASERMTQFMAEPANRKAASDRMKAKWADPVFRAETLARRTLVRESKNRTLQ